VAAGDFHSSLVLQLRLLANLCHIKYNAVQLYSVRYTHKYKVLRGCIGLHAGKVGFQSSSKLSFDDGGRAQVDRKTVPGDRSGDAETSFAGFR